jgi:hypothetical protein
MILPRNKQETDMTKPNNEMRELTIDELDAVSGGDNAVAKIIHTAGPITPPTAGTPIATSGSSSGTGAGISAAGALLGTGHIF